MIKNVELPNGDSIKIQYSEKVYDPNYSSYHDTIGLADMCIREVHPSRVIDVACGSGVLGLSIKHLWPSVEVYMTDLSKDAIIQTKANAKRLKLSVEAFECDLLPPVPFFPLVVANLPTFDERQLGKVELHGPVETYKASDDDGLFLYRRLLASIETGGFLVCEVQALHQEAFIELYREFKFTLVARSEMAFALFKS